MKSSHAGKALLVAMLMVVAGHAVAAKGKLGFAIQATTSGVISPVLKRVQVASVKPGSAAASAGLKPGDAITEVDGQRVAGAPARAMAGKFKTVQVGEKMRLKIQRGPATLDLDLVATH